VCVLLISREKRHAYVEEDDEKRQSDWIYKREVYYHQAADFISGLFSNL